MSSPEYAELRGISGSAVAAKAALQTDPRARLLLFFLQAISLRPGGLKKVTDDFLAMFPERLGTPSMHKFGVKPGTIYNAEQVKVVRGEVEKHGALPQTEHAQYDEIYRKVLIHQHRREDGITEAPRVYNGFFPLRDEFEPVTKSPTSSLILTLHCVARTTPNSRRPSWRRTGRAQPRQGSSPCRIRLLRLWTSAAKRYGAHWMIFWSNFASTRRGGFRCRPARSTI